MLGALVLGVALLFGLQAQDDWSEIVHGDPSTGMVALTFDAGAEAGTAAPQVIEVLRERGVHATFFLSGNWVLKYPGLATEILNDGHEIANHSLTHPELTRLSDNQIVFDAALLPAAVRRAQPPRARRRRRHRVPLGFLEP